MKGLDLQFGSTYQATVLSGELRFDLLLHLKREATGLLVICPNAIPAKLRAAGTIPYFPRHTWVEDFSQSVVIVNDPVLYLDPDIRLGWLLGTEEAYATDLCLDIIDDLLARLGLAERDLTFMGSSGGGFVALMMGARRPAAAVFADMPQTNVFRYLSAHWQRCLSVSFPGMTQEDCLAAYPERFVVSEAFDRLAIPRLIHYVQNWGDWHYRSHLLPFLQQLEGIAEERKRNTELRLLLYDAGVSGHNPLSKERTIEIVSAMGAQPEEASALDAPPDISS